MISRTLIDNLDRLVGKFPILTITGPRQSGKTTLIKMHFSDYMYFNLENPEIRNIIKDDTNGFLRANGPLMILDEVQRLPEIFSNIQAIVDESPEYSFILSGSQHFLLMEEISQSLAGRTALFELLPLTWKELAKANLLSDEVSVNLWKGGYPRIYDKDILPFDFFPSYVSTYIDRDIRLMRGISDLDTFQKFLFLIAGRAGHLINYNELANDTGISPKTAKQWLHLLEKTYIIFKLLPYHKNFNKRLIKSAKIYFYDTGLLSYLLQLKDPNQYFSHYAKGQLFENAIVAELKKNQLHERENINFYFWRDNHGNEVDVIIERGNNVFDLIELKAGETAKPAFMNKLYWLEDLIKTKCNKYVIYGGSQSIKTEKFEFRSWRSLIN